MKKVLSAIIYIFLLTLPLSLSSQVKIDIKIDNQEDTMFYLIKYVSDKTYSIIDSTNISSKKKIFSSPTNYEEGIYMLADSRQQPIIEILMGKDQTYSLRIKDLMDNSTYKLKGSDETAAYFKVLAKSVHCKLQIEALQHEIKHYPQNKAKIDSVEKALYEYQESMLSKDTHSFLNTYIKFIQRTRVPVSIKNVKSKKEAYKKEHYFDDLPLCDSRLLNSRLLKNKLDNYFDNYIFTSDSEDIIRKIDALLAKVSDCHDIRDYILWYLYSRYFTPDNIKHEKVYIHLADNYFAKLDIKNLSQNIREEIIKRSDVLKNIIIGATAPSFSYLDENDSIISLDSINSSNIALFFYKPDCQKCIRDKRILGLIENRRNDFKVLSIDVSKEENDKELVPLYDISTSPSIFLLNKNKKIIAKGIKAEEVEFYLIKNH